MRMTPDQYMASLPLPEVYRVGGSVRDELLGRRSKDRDYMVRGASLTELGQVLHQAGLKPNALRLRDGRQAGWRAVLPGWGLLEIVLPRTERSTGPGRRDFEIIVEPDLPLADDAVRRDFTVNALYKPLRAPDDGVEVTLIEGAPIADPLGKGIADLRAGRISTTHTDSFRDDPLRTLRALRFVSKLDGFDLEPFTRAQMEAHAQHVTGLTDKGVSGTVLTELEGILMGSRPGKALRIARDTGVLAYVLPELEPMLGFEQRSAYHDKTTDEHTFDALDAAAAMSREHAPLRVRMALLFHDSGKPDTAWIGEDGRQHYYALTPERAVALGAGPKSLSPHEYWGAERANAALKRLNASKPLRRDVEMLIERHMLPLSENIKPFKVRKWRAELGDEMLRDLIAHRTCDVIGKGGDISDALEVLTWIEQIRADAQKRGVPVDHKGLKIGGRDLIELGLQGRDIGRVLDQLLHEVLAQPKLNEREWLLQRAESLR